MIRNYLTITCFLLCLSACGKDCVTCKDGQNEVELCEDAEYTDSNGEIISFDAYLEQERMRGIECN